MTLKTPNPHRLGHIAAALREVMTRLGLTPAEVSQRLGLPKGSTTIYGWLAARAAPHPDMREKLVKVLNLRMEDVTPREEAPMVPPVRAAAGRALAVIAHKRPGSGPGRPTNGGGGDDVFSFRVAANGMARITLNVELELARATPLFRMLMDAGLVLGPAAADETQ
jgi:transcriptional regulator with XRE-family HTH domain